MNDNDEQRIRDLIQQALKDYRLPDDQVSDLSDGIYSAIPTNALRKIKRAAPTRFLNAGANVDLDSTGAGVGHSGPTMPDIINITGATMSLERGDGRQLNIAVGGGEVCYDFIIDAAGTGTHTSLDQAWPDIMAFTANAAPTVLICGVALTGSTALVIGNPSLEKIIFIGLGQGNSVLRTSAFNNMFSITSASSGVPGLVFRNMTLMVSTGQYLVEHSSGVSGALDFILCEDVFFGTGIMQALYRYTGTALGPGAAAVTLRRCSGRLHYLLSYNGSNTVLVSGPCIIEDCGNNEQVTTLAMKQLWDFPSVTYSYITTLIIANNKSLTFTERIAKISDSPTTSSPPIIYLQVTDNLIYHDQSSSDTTTRILLEVDASNDNSPANSANWVVANNIYEAISPNVTGEVRALKFTGHVLAPGLTELVVQGNVFGIQSSSIVAGPAVEIANITNAKIGPNVYHAGWTTKYTIPDANNFETTTASVIAGLAAANEPFVTYGPSTTLTAARQYVNVGSGPPAVTRPEGSYYYDTASNNLYLASDGAGTWTVPMKFRVYTSLGESPVTGASF